MGKGKQEKYTVPWHFIFQVLSNMEENGPMVLLQPQDLYSLCIYIGLLPRPMDVASTNPNLVSTEC